MGSNTDKLTIGERIFEELCFDADVWLTHGLPNESKQIKIIAKIDAALADTMRENERLRSAFCDIARGSKIRSNRASQNYAHKVLSSKDRVEIGKHTDGRCNAAGDLHRFKGGICVECGTEK